MATATINGIHFYYEDRGDGIPLMLIAGLASDSQSWGPIVADTARPCRVIAPDNRGVGRTAPQDVRISIQAIADDCIALARHLGVPSVNVLGHSMGGFVAMDMAARYPESVNRLILAGTAASNSARNNALFAGWVSGLKSGMDSALWFRNIFRWIFSARFFENESAVSEAVRLAVQYPYPQSAAAFEEQVKAIAEYDGRDGLARIRTKTLVIAGREDRLFPVEVCAGLVRSIPGATLAVIDNAAHSIHMEQPRLFTDCVLNFLLGR